MFSVCLASDVELIFGNINRIIQQAGEQRRQNRNQTQKEKRKVEIEGKTQSIVAAPGEHRGADRRSLPHLSIRRSHTMNLPKPPRTS